MQGTYKGFDLVPIVNSIDRFAVSGQRPYIEIELERKGRWRIDRKEDAPARVDHVNNLRGLLDRPFIIVIRVSRSVDQVDRQCDVIRVVTWPNKAQCGLLCAT